MSRFRFMTLTALLALPSVAAAQFPMGGGMGGGIGGGRPMGSRTGGIQQTEGLEPRADPGPKSEELVDLKPILRGIKLLPAQDSAVKAIRDRYEPQLLPIYDWLRDQMVKKQKGQELDMALVQRRFDRVDALRRKEVEEVRLVLTEEQQVRFLKNVDEQREADAINASRADAIRQRQQQRPPA